MIKESEVKKDMAATGDVVRKIHFHVQPPFSFLDLLLFIYFFLSLLFDCCLEDFCLALVSPLLSFSAGY